MLPGEPASWYRLLPSYLQLIQFPPAQAFQGDERAVFEDRPVIRMGNVQMLQWQPCLLHHQEHCVLQMLSSANKCVVILEEIPELGCHAVIHRIFGKGTSSAYAICAALPKEEKQTDNQSITTTTREATDRSTTFKAGIY